MFGRDQLAVGEHVYLPEKFSVSGRTLTIRNVTPADAGYYDCLLR